LFFFYNTREGEKKAARGSLQPDTDSFGKDTTASNSHSSVTRDGGNRMTKENEEESHEVASLPGAQGIALSPSPSPHGFSPP